MAEDTAATIGAGAAAAMLADRRTGACGVATACGGAGGASGTGGAARGTAGGGTLGKPMMVGRGPERWGLAGACTGAAPGRGGAGRGAGAGGDTPGINEGRLAGTALDGAEA